MESDSRLPMLAKHLSILAGNSVLESAWPSVLPSGYISGHFNQNMLFRMFLVGISADGEWLRFNFDGVLEMAVRLGKAHISILGVKNPVPLPEGSAVTDKTVPAFRLVFTSGAEILLFDPELEAEIHIDVRERICKILSEKGCGEEDWGFND